MQNIVYNSQEYIAKKNEILSNFGVNMDKFDPKKEIQNRVDYLKKFIKDTKLKGFVLGISGGVDSTTAGKLAQIACTELRQEGIDAKFIAMRLPSGVQFDEDDAQKALSFINPDFVLNVNIADSANAINKECLNALVSIGNNLSDSDEDFHKGNVKARIRMSSQYYVAGVYSMAVISTDHFSEAVTGFFTKFGDGAADLTVLDGLIKTQVRLVAKELGAPQKLYDKPPTADLEELNPGKLDDVGFGFPYDELDNFLMGKDIDPQIEKKIIAQYVKTQHKRDPIVSFLNS